MLICKHRERDASCCLQSREIPHLRLWMVLKPLESISRKNLADTPAWLQCMMLHLWGYDFTIHYHPGQEMVIPDTLSRFSPWPGPNLPLDIAIHHAHIMPALADLIITGWPEDIKEVPHPLHPYWQHRETLTIKDSLVL